MAKFVNHAKSCYKRNGKIGWLFVGCIKSFEINLSIEKRYTNEWDCKSIYVKHVTKQMGPTVGSFTGFCHHLLATIGVQMYAYHYLCLKVK